MMGKAKGKHAHRNIPAFESVRDYPEGKLAIRHHLPRRPTGMLTAKCIGILKMYRKKLASESGKSAALDHVVDMIPKAIGFFENHRREKAFRWLGFIQGVLWTEGIYTIEEMKNHNRPDQPEEKE